MCKSIQSLVFSQSATKRSGGRFTDLVALLQLVVFSDLVACSYSVARSQAVVLSWLVGPLVVVSALLRGGGAHDLDDTARAWWFVSGGASEAGVDGGLSFSSGADLLGCGDVRVVRGVSASGDALSGYATIGIGESLDALSGAVTLASGSSEEASSGDVSVQSGDAATVAGCVSVSGGSSSSWTGGAVNVESDMSSDVSGLVSVRAGLLVLHLGLMMRRSCLVMRLTAIPARQCSQRSQTGSFGSVYVSGGSSSSSGSGGAVRVSGGSSSSGVGGEVTLSSGDSGSSAVGSRAFVRSGSGGNLATSRETSSTVGADVEFVAGGVDSTDAGTVLLTSGSGAVSACILSGLVNRCHVVGSVVTIHLLITTPITSHRKDAWG
ncbi:hypothetical protein C6341_g8965 [Phytophthora cactorum]|nr:hypothetical protein C6341_g8965 [Phytophthora cactorum]